MSVSKISWGFQTIAHLSPSQIWSLKKCSLKFAFDRMRPPYEKRIANTFALLGIISHRVVEIASKRRPELNQTARIFLEDVWAEEEQRQLDELRLSSYCAHLLEPETWPRYALAREEAIHKAGQFLSERPHAERRDSVASSLTRMVERMIISDKYRLIGVIDRVQSSPNGPVIIDWKSTLPDGDDASQVEKYRLQLMGYALLYFDEKGVWPREARLETFSGEMQRFELTEEEGIGFARDILKLIEGFNARVTAENSDALANPASDVCSNCAMRGWCNRYWALRPEVPTFDIEGVVLGKNVSPTRSEWSLKVENTNKQVYELRELSPLQFFYLRDLQVGSQVRIVGFVQSKAVPEKLLPRNNSYVVSLPS